MQMISVLHKVVARGGELQKKDLDEALNLFAGRDPVD
jgi:hypothetical protein